MKKKIETIYFVYAMILGALFLYMCVSIHNSVMKQDIHYGYEILSDVNYRFYRVNGSAQGAREEYSFVLDKVNNNYNWLVFYSCHQNVSVYLDSECIYKIYPSSKNPFGKTTGYVWNSVAFNEADIGKTVKVLITPLYKSSIGTKPQFYFGDRFDIIMRILLQGLPIMILSGLMLIVGLIYIFICIANGRKREEGSSLLFIGIFSVLVGLWKLSELEAFAFVCARMPAISYMPFIALMMMAIPFILYIKEMFQSRESILWYIVCIISLVQIAIITVLQVYGKTDFRQTMLSTHIIMGMVIILTVIMAVREWREKGWTRRVKRTILCLFACLMGAVLDLLIYYLTAEKESSVLAILFFAVFILVMGYSSVQEISELMEEGIRALHLDKIAHHDQLTGLFNRTAYEEKIADEHFDETKYVMIMLDLNNLKKCNDILGHAKGDIYITESAKIIYESFGDIGECYRVGGDEFCVFLRSTRLDDARRRIDIMHEKVKAFNEKTDTGINMQIACGYETYDKRIDYDIGDTVRRADKKMYEDKKRLKEMAAQEEEATGQILVERIPDVESPET